MKDQGGGQVIAFLFLIQNVVKFTMLGCDKEELIIAKLDLSFLKDQVDGLVENANDLRIRNGWSQGDASQANMRRALRRRFSTRTRTLFRISLLSMMRVF